jgi:hypothetical protein
MTDVKLPQRTVMSIAGAYILADITDIKLAGIVAVVVIIGILCRTYTKIVNKQGETK